MKVLMTADAAGGVWPYALELGDALAVHGVETTLAVMGPAPSPEQEAEARGLRIARLEHGPFALEWTDDPWDDVEVAGEWLLALADEARPDLVHLNGYAHAVLEWPAPVLVAGHSCVLSWFAAVRRAPAPPRFGRYADAVARGLAAADFLVAPTRAFLAELERLYRPSCPRRAIANGRRPLSPPLPKEPFVLGAGRLWDEGKNAAALDGAAASLPWPVLLAGEAGAAEPRHARPLGRLASHELAPLLGRASVYAAPASYEPFGLGALEAALAGCALVLGDIATLREVWGDDALFVASGDEEALTAALRLLIEEEPRRRELGERARRRALTYTPERMALSYIAVYRELAAARARVVV